MKVSYTIPYPPTPWAASRKSKNCFYNPRDKEKKRDIACIKAQKVWERQGAIRVDCIFYMPIPKTTPKKKREALEKETTWHVKKSDADNLRKYINDVLEIAGVFKNDSQVCFGYVAKIYSANPRTEIYVEEVPYEFDPSILSSHT